ncbi:hypothetical protein OsI_26833 [Oryza sativa Indica Group]|uniref:Uncharacterized protein n=1 Tax=Oryza sativa subsp. indica TaxID=39946 RepID=B8B8D0_ORYSI|nr:hypothetical protein OsI_26833 [Oryza sativa Indica Group]
MATRIRPKMTVVARIQFAATAAAWKRSAAEAVARRWSAAAAAARMRVAGSGILLPLCLRAVASTLGVPFGLSSSSSDSMANSMVKFG